MKTADEIKKIQTVYARNHHIDTRTLRVMFETTPDALRTLLPPPLEPTPEPLGMAWVSEMGTSTSTGPFQSAALFVRARYGDITGYYCLSMPVSTPEAVAFGREIYGEPRKHAKIIFERKDEYVWGSAERHEIRFLSMRGRMIEVTQTDRIQDSYFSFKYLPRADGSGFESPPRLVHVTEDLRVQKALKGQGELIFRDSAHDPVADIPVTEVIEGRYIEGHVYTSANVLCEVDPDEFLPYSFTGTDAYDLVAEGTLLHAQAARRSGDGRGRWRGSQASAI